MDLFNVFARDFQIYLDMDLWWSLYLWWQLQRHSSILLDQKPGMILKHIMLGIWVEAMLRFPASLLTILKVVISLGFLMLMLFPTDLSHDLPFFLVNLRDCAYWKQDVLMSAVWWIPFVWYVCIYIYIKQGQIQLWLFENRCQYQARYCFVAGVSRIILLFPYNHLQNMRHSACWKNTSLWAVDECGKYLCASWNHYFFA